VRLVGSFSGCAAKEVVVEGEPYGLRQKKV
jgi:hypothetical protein